MRRKSRRNKPTRSRSRKRAGGGLEWIGGRLAPPIFDETGTKPVRVEMVLWVEASSGLVVGYAVGTPEDLEGAVARTLLKAMEGPLAGSVRRPDALRVADASLAAEVRTALGDSIPITVAPTPELDAFVESMLESMPEPDEDRSYLEGGSLPAAAVREMFIAAESLHGVAPWDVATEDQVFRMDIPALGVEGACVSILGNEAELIGLLIFPSFDAWTAFVEAGEQTPSPGERIDMGTDWMSLTFGPGAELPAPMLKEAMAHAWPVAAADAYPRVDHPDRDGLPLPITEQDLEIVAAAADAIGGFCAKHYEEFAADEFEPVCESFLGENKVEVRFTLPYEAFPLVDAARDAPNVSTALDPQRYPKVGRNDPCPCGSGRKYKKCHLPRDEEHSSARAHVAAGHDLDGRLAQKLSRFAKARFDSEWRGFMKDFVNAADVIQIAIAWSLYHYRVEGATVAEWYLREKERSLSRAERSWLDAQQAAWLSVWEVTDVEQGARLTLRDLLTGETREVREVSGSETLVARDALLARVVDADAGPLLCGAHPRPLAPTEAAEVVRLARGRLRRKRAVPVERLRDEAFGRYLIRRWEEAVQRSDALRAIPPVLQNTDGDPLLLTTDHYEISPAARPDIEARLAALPGVEHQADDEDPDFVFLRPGSAGHAGDGDTVVGRAVVSDTTLQLETNSVKRADALRDQVEAACGEQIRHRAREHTDPLSSKLAPSEREPAREPASAEQEQLLLEFKKRHYADWPDHPLPALDGETPRQAIRTAQGRSAVDVVLKDMENLEQRSHGGAAYDFSELRRELRLEES